LKTVSLFRFAKYSTILFFLNRHRSKLFRSVAVLLFALVTALLYDDLRAYLEARHPETLIYALGAKIVIVYGALAFVLFQFRPDSKSTQSGEARAAALAPKVDAPAKKEAVKTPPQDRLQALADLDDHDTLRTRYDRILAGEESTTQAPKRSSTKSRRS